MIPRLENTQYSIPLYKHIVPQRGGGGYKYLYNQYNDAKDNFPLTKDLLIYYSSTYTNQQIETIEKIDKIIENLKQKQQLISLPAWLYEYLKINQEHTNKSKSETEYNIYMLFVHGIYDTKNKYFNHFNSAIFYNLKNNYQLSKSTIPNETQVTILPTYGNDKGGDWYN